MNNKSSKEIDHSLNPAEKLSIALAKISADDLSWKAGLEHLSILLTESTYF